jgi:hypothetical protein
MQRCGVRAGGGSTITCTNATSCVVECQGNCHVLCTDQVGRCDVTCAHGSPVSCASGTVACGPC